MPFISINEKIQCKYVQSSPYGSSSGSLALYCPSLMPNIGMGSPKSTPFSLNKSAFCNASDCKPSISSRINTQNFITGLPPYHDFNHSCYWFGSGVTVRADSEDMLTVRISPEDEDNSTIWP